MPASPIHSDSDSDDDGLDIVPAHRWNPLESKTAVHDDVVDLSSDTQSEQQPPSTKTTTIEGARIAFDNDEDSDTVYKQFKKRKSGHKQDSRIVKQKSSRRSNNKTFVGRKINRGGKAKAKEREWMPESDEDEVLMETSLPDFLKQRYAKWAQDCKELGTKALRYPPEDSEVEFSDDERMADLMEKPHLPPHMRIPGRYEDVFLKHSGGFIPAPIAQWLRDYQIKGVDFLHKLFVHQRGGLLGDDMGLGKTIQVIAFLTAAFNKVGDERDSKRMRKMRRSLKRPWYPRILLICPGSLIANWQKELDTWGWWHIYVFHDNLQAKESAISAAKAGRLEIMITTYATYRLNMDVINGVRWDCVIADECHIIKETDSKITVAMNEVNSLCRIGLTGTAIQNKYEELWTLLNWTNPGELGPLSSWKHSLCIPMKMGQSHEASIGQIAKARRLAEQLVKNVLPIYFLRRTKALIADQLPKKSDRVVFCQLTETQTEAYNNFCDTEIIRVIRDHALLCPCGSGSKQGFCCNKVVDNEKWQAFVFPALATLQKLANHLALLLPEGEADPEKHDKDLQKLRMALPDAWEELYRSRDSIIEHANTDFCGKWRVLTGLLKLWYHNGDKVLVFSHSVKLLRLLQKLFSLRTNYNVSYLDGSMKLSDRQQAVDDFNSNPQQFVFLISTRAGGVGLNITSANKVVVFDPNWNPSYDLQAQDRAYRIGQVRDVDVFRLVSVGTVEEIVYARQIYKQQQANIAYNASHERRYFKGVQDRRDQKGEIFGLSNLFAPPSSKIRLQDIVNKTNVAESRAGFSIAGIDLEDDGEGASKMQERAIDEDDAMSQLAAEVTGERKTSMTTASAKDDPVLAILASAGVEYTHDNAEVVGTSAIETRISTRAQQSGNDIDYSREMPFARPRSSQADTEFTTMKYKYHPPEDVRRRQFCSMALGAGFSDVTEFALGIEASTQVERRAFLDRWYSKRREALAAE